MIYVEIVDFLFFMPFLYPPANVVKMSKHIAYLHGETACKNAYLGSRRSRVFVIIYFLNGKITQRHFLKNSLIFPLCVKNILGIFQAIMLARSPHIK